MENKEKEDTSNRITQNKKGWGRNNYYNPNSQKTAKATGEKDGFK